jgi:hypothetical protein
MKDIDKEFDKLIYELNDNQFWEYVRTWYDEQDICDTMKAWDTKTKKMEIKVLKNIIKEGK